MSASKDLTGQRFGKLVVIERAGSNKHKCCVWKCKCDCGNITYTTTQYLKKGDTRSCGCIRGKHNRTHGMTNAKLDRTYKNMIGRCYAKNNKEYKNYGERGILVCEEWLEKPNGKIKFFEWAIENGFSDNLTLDRIDVNGNYEPDNCRWVDWTTQAINRRNYKSKTGIRGVYQRENRSELYEVYICVNKKQKFLGCFKEKEEAIRARKEAELKYFGYTL